MSVEIIPAAHHLILREDAPELASGDAVAFTINDWERGEREITGEVVRLTAPDHVKVRVGKTAFVLPNRACVLVMPAAHRRAA
jgi:hypothetical protein